MSVGDHGNPPPHPTPIGHSRPSLCVWSVCMCVCVYWGLEGMTRASHKTHPARARLSSCRAAPLRARGPAAGVPRPQPRVRGDRGILEHTPAGTGAASSGTAPTAPSSASPPQRGLSRASTVELPEGRVTPFALAKSLPPLPERTGGGAAARTGAARLSARQETAASPAARAGVGERGTGLGRWGAAGSRARPGDTEGAR